MNLKLIILKDLFTIHRLPTDGAIPDQLTGARIFHISRTDEEMTIVCSSSLSVPSEMQEDGWVGIKVCGPLDFSVTGILAGISSVLANAGIPVFVISTFQTDYIFVKSDRVQLARKALEQADYSFIS